MNIFKIYIAWISWENGGKHRPVLVIDRHEDTVTAFNITSQYENKSNVIKARYCPIRDWREAGLSKPSYVDTTIARDVPLDKVDVAHPVGTLTDFDIERLIDFL